LSCYQLGSDDDIDSTGNKKAALCMRFFALLVIVWNLDVKSNYVMKMLSKYFASFIYINT
jgi:hypothetical protein